MLVLGIGFESVYKELDATTSWRNMTDFDPIQRISYKLFEKHNRRGSNTKNQLQSLGET